MSNEQITYLVDTKPGFKRPVVRDFGRNGNAFSLMAQVSSALRYAGHDDVAKEFQSRALASHSYDDVLILCADYGRLELTDAGDDEEEEEWEDEDEE